LLWQLKKKEKVNKEKNEGVKITNLKTLPSISLTSTFPIKNSARREKV
jgi:hypothetical protein